VGVLPPEILNPKNCPGGLLHLSHGKKTLLVQKKIFRLNFGFAPPVQKNLGLEAEANKLPPALVPPKARGNWGI